jgi:hypothetical protein
MSPVRTRPTIEEVICWANAWGDEIEHRNAGRNPQWLRGYHEAMYEVLGHLTDATDVDWLPTWRSRSWMRLRREAHVAPVKYF